MSKILFTPGPTNVPEEIRQVLGQDLIHHRMADYHQRLSRRTDLKIIKTTKSCIYNGIFIQIITPVKELCFNL